MIRTRFVVVFAAALAGGALLAPSFDGRVPAAEARSKAKPASKEAKVRKFLQLTGADDLGKQMIDSMMAEFGRMPNIPPGFTDKFRELAMKDDLAGMMVPVYMKHLDEKDLDGAIAFYESEAGRNFVKAQPVILQESMAIGQRWGQELAQKTIEALEKEGKGPSRR